MRKLIIIEDSSEIVHILTSLFKKEYDIITASDGETGLMMLETENPNVAIVDQRLPKMNGIDLIAAASTSRPNIPTIMLTAYSGIEQAVEAMKAGAFNYMSKPINAQALKMVVASAMKRSQILAENTRLRQVLERRFHYDSMLGRDSKMEAIFRLLQSLGPTTAAVLLTGEPGTGKNLLARIIHHNSVRKSKPFVLIDISSLHGAMLESALFGHVRGSFPGATSTKLSQILNANGGTVYLSGIDQLPLDLQSKLLRIIQDNFIEVPGEQKKMPVDVRWIAASNRDVEPMLENGAFRKDLYYRLNVVGLTLPSLVDRREDISFLADHFIKQFSHRNSKQAKPLSVDALNLLLEHDWPGNVRELENAIEHAVVVSHEPRIEREHLPIKDRIVSVVRKPHQSLSEALEGPEKHILLTTLKEYDWNRKRTAEALQVTRATLYNKMKKYDIQNP